MLNSSLKFGIPSAMEVYFPDAVYSEETKSLLEERFFRMICLPNGTYKTTAAHRLCDIDKALCQCLEDRPKGLNVLDVAVSSGVTSLELLDALAQQGFNPRLTAADLTIHATLGRLPYGIEILCDSKGRILQLARPPFVKGRPHEPFRSFRRAALQGFITLLESLIRVGILRQIDSKEITLVSPRMLNKAGITITEHDLNEDRPEWHAQFDVVRAANILNDTYFSRAVLRRMFNYLCLYLKPNGLLVLSRTMENDNSTHGTIFALSADGKLCVVRRIGEGSDLEYLIDEPLQHSQHQRVT